MRIKADLLKIRNFPRDDVGNKIEPEQQPLQRVLVTDGAPVSMQGSGEVKGTIPAEIVYNTSVGEFANALRRPCHSCKRFDTRWWLKMKALCEDPTGPKENRAWLNGIRAYLLETQNATIQSSHVSQEGDMDVEHALSVLGVCQPLTEINGDPVIVYPTGACPNEICTPDKPHGYYDAKDRDNERMGSSVYDDIMRKATGARV